MKPAAFALAVLLVAANAAAAPSSCRDEVGPAKARTYVAQCLAISPATHPPCNAGNPCARIIDEIVRGCRIDRHVNDGHGVEFCKRYLKSPQAK